MSRSSLIIVLCLAVLVAAGFGFGVRAVLNSNQAVADMLEKQADAKKAPAAPAAAQTPAPAAVMSALFGAGNSGVSASCEFTTHSGNCADLYQMRKMVECASQMNGVQTRIQMTDVIQAQGKELDEARKANKAQQTSIAKFQKDLATASQSLAAANALVVKDKAASDAKDAKVKQMQAAFNAIAARLGAVITAEQQTAAKVDELTKTANMPFGLSVQSTDACGHKTEWDAVLAKKTK
ncbi:MAG: hypothetical protein ABSF55_03195 [Candidatus Staskawiczbacteria bacterium]|jgi:hypothetical protein